MWIVMGVYPFAALRAGGFEVKTTPGEPTHFMPAFETREAAERWNAGRFEIVEMRQKKVVPS